MNQPRLSDHAYAGIVELIKSKDLEVGARLPSEAGLAEMFGVSRAIVREALVRLASDGITEARRGAGSFVKNRPSERLAAFMPMSELPATLGSYEVRFVLEAEAARLAATRRSSLEMAHVDEGMDMLREALLSNAPAHDEDMELHRRIAAATGNPAFLIAFDALWSDVEKIMRAGVDISRSRPPEVIATMLREHELIVGAIRAQDAEGAALAMRWHLWEGRRRLMP
ncbi:MAG: GntR family transcriptional regulator [Novosphingobium lindaniclasticum]|jgi:DNA-binding FadR family transcriptional regulator|uniref:FadR/GntR family transcriptional regulator n=1 Tax=Novosphingobium lindaniclasticum TaxID=1329895 RepID=UPI00240946B6|nr:FCD domain-containing protein [Novosphingobium lindaniclasticum]MDF2638698.1 GntR family transcriptional regulator [Novosphingobium lindaniclasticum]